MKKMLMASCVTLALAGCASQTPLDPQVMALAERPLVCNDKAQCDRYWQAAQVWIAENSNFKIQTISDTLIQTYGPVSPDTDLAYTVMKVPQSGGANRIMIRAGCGNMFGCHPRPAEAAAKFKSYVLSVGGR